MGNYTPNPFMTQPIYDPTRPFATPIYGVPVKKQLYVSKVNFFLIFLINFIRGRVNKVNFLSFTCQFSIIFSHFINLY